MRARRAAAALLLAVALVTPAREACGGSGLLLLPEAPRIKKIEITGVSKLDSGDLKGLLTLKTPDFLHPFRKPRFYRGVVQQEARTLENWARARGFARANVTWDTTSVAKGVNLFFRVEEGTAITVSESRIRGLTEGDRRRIAKEFKEEPGKPFTLVDLESDRTKIGVDMANRGHPFYRLSTYTEIGADSALIVHRIDPGDTIRIGEVGMEHAEGVNERGLRRELTVHPGDIFNQKELERSRQRLYDTGFFRDVTVTWPPAGIDTVNNSVGVLFGLEQRKQKWISGGVGYTSDNLLRLTAEWGTRSLFGTGRSFRLNARTAREIFGDHEFFYERETLAQATLGERWLFGTRIHGQLQAYYHYDNIRNEFVRQTSYGMSAETSYELKERRSSVALIYEARRTNNDVEPDSVMEMVCSEDPSLCQDRYITRSMTGRLTLDERDDFLNPTRGHRHELALENAGGLLGGDSNFLKALDNSSAYIRKNKGRTVLGGRLRVGAIDPAPGLVPGGGSGMEGLDDVTSVPFEERFITGGANTVRGYQENTLNGLPNGQDPTGGGVFELVMNLESRFTIRGALGGVLFVDAGNVWRSIEQVKLSKFAPTFDRDETTPENLRWSVGGGLRFNSPVGPIRLEGAVRLSPAHGDYPSDLHLAVGQTF